MLAEPHGGADFSPYWGDSEAPPLEDFEFCDCPGPPPPPKFVIPPPPPSPSSPLCQGARPTVGGGASHQQDPPFLQFCSLEPVGAEFTQTAFPSLPIIAVCSSIVLVAILVASFLLWKHKRKVQNFLPCKSQGRCDIPVGSAPGITYDDVLINHHPTRLPPNHQHPPPPHITTTDPLTPIELLDVKYGTYIQKSIDPHPRMNFATTKSNKEQQAVLATVRNLENNQRDAAQNHQPQPQSNRRRSHTKGSQGNNAKKKDHFHPIYEEVSAASDDKINPNGHSYDSDIEDSEVESRTIASEDEFAEDELSVAGEFQPANQEGASQPDSATSSLQGSTGGDLYPDVVTGSNERFLGNPNSEPQQHQQSRTLKNVFRGLELGSGLKKHTHSLERNKDGHPSNSFQAKQNYYLNKSMLGPDFTFGEGDVDMSQPCVTDFGQSHPDIYLGSRGIGSSLNFLPHILQQQQQQRALSSRSTNNSPPPPPYAACTNTSRVPNNAPKREIISALYNPHIVSPTMMPARLPDAIMRELAFKLPGNQPAVPVVTIPSTGAMSSRSLPVPPACRSAGTGMVFTLDSLDNPYPSPPTSSMSRTRSGSATEFGFQPYHHHQQQHVLGGGRPPTPPPPENIYASIDDEGLFTIDGNRHRGAKNFVPSRKGSTEFRNTFGRSRPLTAKVGTSEGNGFEPTAPNGGRRQDNGDSYGDIRSNFDSRTACS